MFFHLEMAETFPWRRRCLILKSTGSRGLASLHYYINVSHGSAHYKIKNTFKSITGHMQVVHILVISAGLPLWHSMGKIGLHGEYEEKVGIAWQDLTCFKKFIYKCCFCMWLFLFIIFLVKIILIITKNSAGQDRAESEICPDSTLLRYLNKVAALPA